MQYYMLDKNDISVVRGIVNTKDVMRELGITNAQFHKMLRNEETYKGCILLPVETDEEERRKVTSEDDEQFQLIGESKTGIRYYITSYLRVVSVDLKGNQKEMKSKKETESIYRVAVNFKEGRRYLNVLFEAWKRFSRGNKAELQECLCHQWRNLHWRICWEGRINGETDKSHGGGLSIIKIV